MTMRILFKSHTPLRSRNTEEIDRIDQDKAIATRHSTRSILINNPIQKIIISQEIDIIPHMTLPSLHLEGIGSSFVTYCTLSFVLYVETNME